MTPSASFSSFDPAQLFSAALQSSTSAAFPLSGPSYEGSAEAKLDLVRVQAYEALLRWGQRPDREVQARLVFGPGYDVAALSDYFDALATPGSADIPGIDLVADSLLKGANGVYASALDDIYISRQFAETASLDALTDVLLEEWGHGLDARVNSTDAAGDEGDLFARSVLGKAITATELALLKAEDDSQTIVINGQQLDVEMNTVFNNRLYQVMRGDDNGVYTRSSADGDNWTDWTISGDSTKTLDTPSMTTFRGKLYQTIRGVDNGIYTRSSSNGTDWTSWTSDAGGTLDAPSIEVFNDRMFQTVRGGDNGIHTRSSADGITWENWRNDGGGTLDAPSISKFGDRLFQSVRGGDNGIYTRFSYNGYNWTGWNNLGGGTYNTPEIASFNGKLYQTVRGGDNAIHMRTSVDGANWTNWQNTGGSVTSKISMVEFGGKLRQVAIGTDQKVYFRSSLNGQSWGGFQTAGNLRARDSNYVVPQPPAPQPQPPASYPPAFNTFGDPNKIISEWNTKFYRWDGQGTPDSNDLSTQSLIGTVSLGANRRSDGQLGMNPQNWGAGSPLGDSRIPADNFVMTSYTRANLVQGQKYTLTVRADDGYRIWAHKLDGNYFDITENAGSGQWQKDAFGSKTIEFTAPESGTFDLHAQMFEQGGDAYFDLAWGEKGMDGPNKNDFNKDGQSDLLFRDSDGNVIVWLSKDHTQRVNLGKIGSNYQFQGTGDFNGDGYLDILWRRNTGEIDAWHMNGLEFSESVNYGGHLPQDGNVRAIADIDGDGKADPVWQLSNNQIVAWYEIDHTQRQVLGTVQPGQILEGAGDFNGDGTVDLMFRRQTGEIDAWYLDHLQDSRQVNVSQPVQHGGHLPQEQVLGFADINQDGKTDTLWRTTDGTVSVWYDKHHAYRQNLGSIGDDWSFRGLGDMNKDGNTDLIWRKNTGEVYAWHMDKARFLESVYYGGYLPNVQMLTETQQGTDRSGSSLPPLHANPTPANPLQGFSSPVRGDRWYVSQPPGGGFSHTGNSYYSIDISIPGNDDLGEPVYAMRGGIVKSIRDRFADTGGSSSNQANFNYVYIEHENGYVSRYIHLQQNFNDAAGLSVGQRVETGQLIGKVGNSGWSTAAHLHVQVDRNDWKTVPFEVDGFWDF